MEYKEPTYEKYLKAKTFAKIRYRYGVYIQAIALVLFLFLIYYAIINIEEMKANPKEYAENKLGVVCFYPMIEQADKFNGSIGNITNIREG